MSFKSDNKGLVEILGTTPGFQGLSPFHKRHTLRLVIEYFFGLKSQRAITDEALTRFSVDLTEPIARIKLTGNGTTFKLWLFYAAKNKLDNVASVRTARRWGVVKKDIREGMRLPRTFIRQLANLPYDAMTLVQFQSIQAMVCKETEQWRKKFAYRKLRFVYQGNGMEQDDIVHELMVHGLRSLGVTYPRIDSELHAVNIAKRSMHNQGMTIIKAATTEKSRRIVNTNGGFESVVTTITEVQANTLPCYAATQAFVNLDYKNLEERILGNLSGKKRLFVELLGGRPNLSFDAFLSTRRKSEVNSENATDKLSRSAHIDLIAEFIQVSPVKCNALLDKIKRTYANPF